MKIRLMDISRYTDITQSQHCYCQQTHVILESGQKNAFLFNQNHKNVLKIQKEDVYRRRSLSMQGRSQLIGYLRERELLLSAKEMPSLFYTTESISFYET